MGTSQLNKDFCPPVELLIAVRSLKKSNNLCPEVGGSLPASSILSTGSGH